MIISIKKDYRIGNFEGEEYIIDLSRKFEGYESGDMICKISPFAPGLPLELEIAIRKNGNLIFRSWKFNGHNNNYLHTDQDEEFNPTPEQIDTVNGLFSGRIKFEGLKLAVGASVQKYCPINVKREEELIGKRIYTIRR